jgi:adenylosuccinate lyase
MLVMSLHALSPLDGRYENETSVLRDYFSEFSYFRMRVQLEEEYLAALARKGICPPFDGPDRPADPQNFTEQDALQIQAYENTTRHDVKAIEYYLRERLPSGLASWIHFGLTSEDINNIAQSIALRDSRDHILLPTLDRLLDSLAGFALRYRALPMLGRTHGQPAVPTTLGKEIAVYLGRLKKGRDAIAGHRFEAKLNGAVGNFNALHAASPDVDWI